MIYISGKITGTDDYLERFEKAEKELAGKGYVPVNPAAVNDRLPKSTSYENYMKMAFTMLEMCDAIYMLDGWESSRGAVAEYHYAYALGKKIIYGADPGGDE